MKVDTRMPLSTVTTLISRGISPRYDEDGYAVINQRCIREHRIDWATVRYTNIGQTKVKPEKFVRQWDGLVNSTGVGTLGRVAQVRTSVKDVTVDSHVTIVRPDLAQFDGRYFGYALEGVECLIETLGEGATGQTELARDRLAEVEVSVPALPTQRKIAAILSAYDDLIENNLRRIKILEEMAQALYREWFVKFRFPGHEHARFVDSPLGRIPEGWEVVAFTDIADVCSGGTPRTTVPEYWDGPIPFFAPKDAPESFYVTTTEKTITEEGLRRCNSRLYPKDTVFITARGTVGKVVMPSVDMAMNQSCYALRGRPGVGQLYLFMATREQVNYLKKNTGGATFDTIVVDTFRRMSVVRPTDDAIATFVELAEPIAEHILITVTESAILRRTRDLLLPKLISGEMDVSELDIAVPEEAMGA